MTQDEWLASWLTEHASKLQGERIEPQDGPVRGAMRNARKRAKLSQQDVAKGRSVSPSAVSRLKRAQLTGSPSPTLHTPQKYAKTAGKRVDIRLV